MADKDSPSLIIRLFGPLDVRCGGAPLRPLRTRKGQWLLALLALRQGREVQREWLAGTLWPDSLESQALYSLRRSLADLRRALGNQAVHLTTPSSRTCRLETRAVYVDVAEFDSLVTRGDPESLEAAIELYRGPLLEGCTEEWALMEQRHREEMLLAALETMAQN